MRRKIFSIRIDPQIYETARKLGFNISRTCENALKQEIQQVKNSKRLKLKPKRLERAGKPSRKG